jgi:NTP pyrophosphatase (non-canonical NTP hydrolase)
MMEHFNGLTPAEAERLALLSEECAEVIQAVAKILRHGYDSYHPITKIGNREALERECGDVRHAMIRLCAAGDLEKEAIHKRADQKADTVAPYLHHCAVVI